MLVLGTLTGMLLGWLMGFLSIFLILLILIQRGKGGGLTGALGGPGGQSAFGSKAGDTFTAITIVVASLWGFTCVLAMLLLSTGSLPPAVANEPNLSDASGDEVEETDIPLFPESGGLGSGTSDLIPSGIIPGDETTPSMELTPADSNPTDSSAAPAETEPAAAQENAESTGASTEEQATPDNPDSAETATSQTAAEPEGAEQPDGGDSDQEN